MKNSLFWPFHRFVGPTSFSIDETKRMFTGDKSSCLYKFSILKSNETRLKISYEMLLTQLLQLDIAITDIKSEQNWLEVKIRLSNILLFVFGLQLVVALILFVLATLYLENSVVKNIVLALPFIIFAFVIINFQFFKLQVVKKLKKQDI